MVKTKPLKIKIAKHACKLCGSYKSGETMSVSREREHRNSLLICKKCVDELKIKADEIFGEKYVCEFCGKEFDTQRGLLIHKAKCDKVKI